MVLSGSSPMKMMGKTAKMTVNCKSGLSGGSPNVAREARFFARGRPVRSAERQRDAAPA